MGSGEGGSVTQNTARKNSWALVPRRAGGQDGLAWWVEQYFQHAVTTSPASQQVQRRDLALFLRYLQREEGTDQRLAWTPRLARAFQQHLRQTLNPAGHRTWSDKTIQRILAHLKTFATWVHTHQPFPLGHPMAAMKLPALGTGLEVDRALTAAERRRLLDAADLLLAIGGRSHDRKRYKTGERPRRKGYRPYRNRAIIYTLIETGMRRAAVTHLDLAQADLAGRRLTVVEKGGHTHTYQISGEGAQALQHYLAYERMQDAARWPSPALFLAAATVPQGTGRLTVGVINTVWNAVCHLAQVQGRTPHSARHAMGKHIIAKTGNIAAVQQQLGHRQATYAMQYARTTTAALAQVLDDR
jgi:site-specific recombinase XerD